ncbi:MAG: hypothetical protein WCS01_11960, partial [bacterium]
MRRSVLAFASILIAAQLTYAKDLASARIFFRVVDDLGAPVSNACIQGYSLSTAGGKSGLTDTNGVYSYYDRSVYGEVSCVISKSGYYDVEGHNWVPKYWG